MRYTVLTLFLLLVCSDMSLGQTPQYDAGNEIREVQDRDTRMKSSEMYRAGMDISPPPRSRGLYRTELTKEEKKRLEPSKANVEKYRSFLNTPKTGIVKILPHPMCDSKIVNVNEPKCFQPLPIFGNGSVYSFFKENHADYVFSNISFKADNLDVQFRDNLLGFIVDLAEKDLNSLTLDTEEIKDLRSFIPTKKYSAIFQQKLLLNQGFGRSGKVYRTNVSAKLNNVYAMRTINYYPRFHLRSIYYKYNDETIVFQVISKDSEGAITLIWKELDKKIGINVSK